MPALADYNALQAGKVVLLSGIPSLILMTMVPILLKRIDIRIAVAMGLLMVTDRMSAVASLLVEAFPVLGRIG